MNFEDHDVPVQIISIQQVYDACLKLAEQIDRAGISFDAIVAIARGGFPPARYLCDFLNIDLLFSIQIRHYSRMAQQQQAKPINTNTADLKDLKVLLLDDINDSGESLEQASQQITTASLLKTAVMHQKASSSFQADFVSQQLQQWRWIIYPWAVTEDLLELLKQGQMLRADVDSAMHYLQNKHQLEVSREVLENALKFKSRYQ